MPPKKTQVESIRHKDKRTNIPTEELRYFVADDGFPCATALLKPCFFCVSHGLESSMTISLPSPRLARRERRRARTCIPFAKAKFRRRSWRNLARQFACALP
jgi:hypothetical protein